MPAARVQQAKCQRRMVKTTCLAIVCLRQTEQSDASRVRHIRQQQVIKVYDADYAARVLFKATVNCQHAKHIYSKALSTHLVTATSSSSDSESSGTRARELAAHKKHRLRR
eukprot:16900-Heterococcus_DN1.PRE.1